MRYIIDPDFDPSYTKIEIVDGGQLVASIEVRDDVVADAVEELIEPLLKHQREQINELLGGES